jgi:hypothetical protein
MAVLLKSVRALLKVSGPFSYSKLRFESVCSSDGKPNGMQDEVVEESVNVS